MSGENAATGSAENNAEVVPAATAPAADPKAEVVSLKDFQELKAQFNATQAQLRILSKQKPPQAENTPANPGTTDAEKITLAALNRKLEESERKQQQTEQRRARSLARSAYKDALKSAGVDDFKASDLADVFIARNESKIRIGDDDSVHLVEADGLDPIPVSKLVTNWLGTDHGKAYLPPKVGPNGEGLNGSGKVQSVHPCIGMDFEKIMELKKRDPATVAEYVAKHPDDFAAKQKNWRPF